MTDGFLEVTAVAASICGMAWLALAMDAHWAQVRGRAPRGRWGARTLRLLGAAAQGVSLVLLSRAGPLSTAVVVWVMTLTASILAVALTLAYGPSVLSLFVAMWPKTGAVPEAEPERGGRDG